MLRYLPREFARGRSRERQQFEFRSDFLGQQPIKQRNQCSTFPSTWPCENSSMLSWPMIQDCLLLSCRDEFVHAITKGVVSRIVFASVKPLLLQRKSTVRSLGIY